MEWCYSRESRYLMYRSVTTTKEIKLLNANKKKHNWWTDTIAKHTWESHADDSAEVVWLSHQDQYRPACLRALLEHVHTAAAAVVVVAAATAAAAAGVAAAAAAAACHGISLCCGISIFPRNFAEVENSSVISTIFELMTYFYHGKNHTELPKAVGFSNSYRNMA